MIPLAIPNVSGNEGRYLQECVSTNFVSSVGPFVSRFETMCAEATGARDAVATSSGTTALHLALTAVGVGRDDLVVLPSFTFIASANAISYCGASPWLFDLTPKSWTLDPALLAAQFESHTRREGEHLVHVPSGRRVAAIMPVYTLGTPPDMDPIRAVADRYGLPVVADAAAAHGARYRGRNIAGLATLTALSFNGNKTITAGGGGVVVGNDEALLRHARHLSTTARTGPGYDHDAVGFNYRLTNLQAAVGCAQMERLDEFVAAKRRIDALYRAQLGDLPGVTLFPIPAWAQSASWYTGVVIPEGCNTAELCGKLRERGIEGRTFWKPVHLQTPYANAPRTDMSICESVWPRVLTLPCSTQLTEAEQATVIAIVRELLPPPPGHH